MPKYKFEYKKDPIYSRVSPPERKGRFNYHLEEVLWMILQNMLP